MARARNHPATETALGAAMVDAARKAEETPDRSVMGGNTAGMLAFPAPSAPEQAEIDRRLAAMVSPFAQMLREVAPTIPVDGADYAIAWSVSRSPKGHVGTCNAAGTGRHRIVVPCPGKIDALGSRFDLTPEGAALAIAALCRAGAALRVQGGSKPRKAAIARLTDCDGFVSAATDDSLGFGEREGLKALGLPADFVAECNRLGEGFPRVETVDVCEVKPEKVQAARCTVEDQDGNKVGIRETEPGSGVFPAIFDVEGRVLMPDPEKAGAAKCAASIAAALRAAPEPVQAVNADSLTLCDALAALAKAEADAKALRDAIRKATGAESTES